MSFITWFASLFGARTMPETPPVVPVEPSAEEMAANLAEQFEGFSAVPYPDPASGNEPWAIGYGSTRDNLGNPITPAHAAISQSVAQEWLVDDMRLAVQDLQETIHTPLTPQERAACDDFIYNCGAGNFNNSTLAKKLNLGDYTGTAAEFDRWDTAAGKVMAGLLRRRQAETDLFKSGPEA
jgi:lysozyme